MYVVTHRHAADQYANQFDESGAATADLGRHIGLYAAWAPVQPLSFTHRQLLNLPSDTTGAFAVSPVDGKLLAAVTIERIPGPALPASLAWTKYLAD